MEKEIVTRIKKIQIGKITNMAKTPVNWDPNRYGSVKHVLKFDAATGTYSLQEQKQSYAGINYNFSSLPTLLTIRHHIPDHQPI